VGTRPSEQVLEAGGDTPQKALTYVGMARAATFGDFSGEEDAQEGAKAVGKMESVIPTKQRPFADLSVQFKSRQKLICDWWRRAPDRLTA
jgi:hypothetical protein